MKSKLLNDNSGEKTYALIFETGDEAMAGLLQFARANHLGAARFTAIGAFRDVVLGYFDWGTKEYKKIPVHEQVEVLSLVGDVALQGDEPKVHAHVVVGRSDGSTRGGHLVEGHVRPTLEVILSESPSHLHKQVDAETGLALIRI
jgi:predicted DNA-binding protein with PD1-like motif